MKRKLSMLFLSVCCSFTFAQNSPKLVVGIVVDQMKYDYLTRFWDKYGEGGFKRIVGDGFSCKNARYNYVPTATGPGHASIYTGTTPRYHGIIGNTFYLSSIKKKVYCVEDSRYKTVGSQSDNGACSPHRLIASTITDQLEIYSNGKSKTIGVSLKDRASILPAGKLGDAAYWYDGTTGHMVSSTYYMEQLPEWMEEFNKWQLPNEFLNRSWTEMVPFEDYSESLPKDESYLYEKQFKNLKQTAQFNYNLKELRKTNGNFELLRTTPYGNAYTLEAAKVIIQNEKMGKHTFSDFLAINLASTDYIGHHFGPQSPEVEDTYVRLDRQLSGFLTFLDNELGEGNYTLFLTSDHGAGYPKSYLRDKKLPLHKETDYETALKKFSEARYGVDLVEATNYGDVYINRSLLLTNNLTLHDVEFEFANFLLTLPYVFTVRTVHTQTDVLVDNQFDNAIKLGYNQKRSGDLFVVKKPYEALPEKGTSHGSVYAYDSYVPIIFYGKGIEQGSTSDLVSITDLAPTIAVILGVTPPNMNIGVPISKALR